MPEPAKAPLSIPAASDATQSRRRAPTEDMDDTVQLDEYKNRIEHGEPEYAPLHSALSLLQKTIHRPFRRCDRKAICYQKLYQVVAILAVVFGALTILLAILEFIVKPPEPLILTLGEPGTAGLTLACIAVGTFCKLKEKWLTARYKAENLRLLKFRKLTDSRLWCPPIDMALLEEELRDEVDKLEAQNYDEAKAWSSHGAHPCLCGPPSADGCDTDKALHELVDYYRLKRLHVQRHYLSRKSKSDERSGSWTALLVQTLFFASFAFVLAHVMVHLATKPAKPEAKVESKVEDRPLSEQWLIALAAGLPVAAAGFRTYRASREFERNALRHRATLDSLETLEEELRGTKELAEKFRVLSFCELVLEVDCREFMRLLCEVEWYG
jgi:hypothetical protein